MSLDPTAEWQHRRREATHEINGVIAWLENQAAIFDRDGSFGTHTPVTMAVILHSRAAKLRKAVDEMYKP